MANTFKKYFLVFAIAGIGSFIPKWRTEYKLWSVPKLSEADLTQFSLPVDLQSRIFLRHELEVCKAITRCEESTLTMDWKSIHTTCHDVGTRIESMSIPPQLPEKIQKNLSLLLEESSNTAHFIAEDWESRLSGKRGGSFWKYLIYWRIEDKDAYSSLPQKIRRLYGLDKLSNSNLVTCKEIESLTSRLPTSTKQRDSFSN